jgi:hypothetical protein
MVISRRQWRAFIDHPVVEWAIFGIGVVLMVLSPLFGAVPGPGGILVFALGFGMVLKTSMWAKRHYARFKRKQPKAGRWIDWGLRRQSAKRREAMRKEQGDAVSTIDPAETEALIPEAPATPPETWGDREGRAHRQSGLD